MKTAHQRHAFNVATLKAMAERVKRMAAPGTLFAIVLFDQEIVGKPVVRRPGEPSVISTGGYSTYISNAERRSMIAALRECADNLECNLDMPGAHPDRAKGH